MLTAVTISSSTLADFLVIHFSLNCFFFASLRDLRLPVFSLFICFYVVSFHFSNHVSHFFYPSHFLSVRLSVILYSSKQICPSCRLCLFTSLLYCSILFTLKNSMIHRLSRTSGDLLANVLAYTLTPHRQPACPTIIQFL